MTKNTQKTRNYLNANAFPLTVAEAMGKEFIKYFQSAAGVDDIGRTFLYETGPKLDLSYRKSKANEFMRFLEKRLFSD